MNWLRKFFAPRSFRLEILKGGRRVFVITDAQLRAIAYQHHGADEIETNGAKANIGHGIQIRVIRS